jgi:CHAT domain-containing protein
VPGSAYDSYLLLGDGEKLPIPDIESLGDLGKIHLVVLSACETALGGAGQDGTEIAGISYYFLSKGAKAVMASLWKVNDESTRRLMEQFYQVLAQGKPDNPMTKAQALRQAQLSFLSQSQAASKTGDRGGIEVVPLAGVQTGKRGNFSHPYYWAPFILMGNPW